MISRDAKVLDPDSAAALRMKEYRSLFDDLYIVVMRGNVFSFLMAFFTAGRFARKMTKGDYVTAQDMESGIVAFVIAKVFRLRLQLQIHTDIFDPYFRKHSVLNFVRFCLAKILLPRADSIRVVSDRIKQSLTQYSKIHVLPIYVDTVLTSDQSLNLKTKYPEFRKIVLIVSRLEKEKNLTMALIAFQKMSRMKEGLGLVIAGTGREEKWLRKYVKHLDIEEKVRFEGWVTDTTSLFKSADLLLVSSFYEGYGMTVIEALSTGCPVVSTDVGVARDAGAIITDFDPGEMALKALEVIKTGKKGELDPKFSISKSKYLEEFKNTFV